MHRRCLIVLICTLLGACVSSRVEQLRHKPGGEIAKGESVVVLGRRQNFRHQVEKDFTSCVYSSLLNRHGLPVKPEEQFMDQMFPWFQPRSAPTSSEQLAQRLSDPALAQRLSEIGTRYIVWLDGVTTRGEDGGNMSCSIGPGGGYCLGLMWWEKDAKYEASIWDMRELQTLGKVTVDATGTSYVPAFIVPVPLIAPTMSTACSNVARQITEFLRKAPATR